METKFRNQFIYLLACAINEKKPEIERVKDIDFKELFYHSKRHSVVAMVAYALEDAGFQKEEIAAFYEEKCKAIRKNILFKNELDIICKQLTENKIWHMPLKGSLLMDLYPKIGMRQLADLDIFYNAEMTNELIPVMENLGYTAEIYEQYMHDVYKKEPFFDVEMHKILMSPFSPASIDEYYKKISSKLVAEKENKYRYNFTNEDYYIYLICHAAKHYYQSGGTGIRTIVDIYRFCAVKGNAINWTYVSEECRKLGLEEFEKDIKRLANTVLSLWEFSLTDSQEFMLDFILDAGTYGVADNIIKGKINYLNSQKHKKAHSKLRYLWFRLFPDLRYMRTYYTVLNKFPFLLPLVWIYRLFLKTFTNSKNAIKEVERLKNL